MWQGIGEKPFFFVYCGVNYDGYFFADPYRDPYGSGERKGSESSGEKGADFFGGVLLHCRGDVTVSVEGESCGVMAQ